MIGREYKNILSSYFWNSLNVRGGFIFCFRGKQLNSQIPFKMILGGKFVLVTQPSIPENYVRFSLLTYNFKRFHSLAKINSFLIPHGCNLQYKNTQSNGLIFITFSLNSPLACFVLLLMVPALRRAQSA